MIGSNNHYAVTLSLPPTHLTLMSSTTQYRNDDSMHMATTRETGTTARHPLPWRPRDAGHHSQPSNFDQYKQRHRPIKKKLRPAFNAVGDFRDVVWRFEVGLAHSDLGHIQGDSVVYASLGFHGRGSCAFGRTPSTAGNALACCKSFLCIIHAFRNLVI